MRLGVEDELIFAAITRHLENAILLHGQPSTPQWIFRDESHGRMNQI